MSEIDLNYQSAVDSELDRLSRLNSCELMELNSHSSVVEINGDAIEVFIKIFDSGDVREIGVITTRKLVVGGRNFVGGMRVKLKTERISAEEAAGLYD